VTKIPLRFHIFAIPLSPPAPVRVGGTADRCRRQALAQPQIRLDRVRQCSTVAHCILQWVVALCGYFHAHVAMRPLVETTAHLKDLTEELTHHAVVGPAAESVRRR
jgi:hypothetical protein